MRHQPIRLREMLRRNRKRGRDADAQGPAPTAVRARTETEPNGDGDDVDDDAAAALLCDDTLAATELLMQRNANGFAALALPPVVLRHQLYTVLSNRTYVDQNVSRLRQRGALVCFRVPTGADDVALVRPSDYLALIRAREAELGIVFDGSETTQRDLYTERTAALAAFRLALPEVAKRPILTVGSLVEIFRQQEIVTHTDTPTATLQAWVAHLQRLGFLLTTTRLDELAYQLSLPGIGKLVTAVKKTRAMLTQTLQRTKYKEAFEHELKKLKYKHTKLEVEYHLTDMEGCGLVRRTRVTSGTLVALVR